jgi:hypothetical protein
MPTFPPSLEDFQQGSDDRPGVQVAGVFCDGAKGTCVTLPSFFVQRLKGEWVRRRSACTEMSEQGGE